MNTVSEENSKPAVKRKMKTVDMIYIALFAALIAVCAWISIPSAVPFTLQTFAICLTAGILGMKRGTLAIVVYLLIGLIGVPVFAGFKGGIAVLFGTTGGYLIGFLFTALLVGFVSDKFGRKIPVMAVAMIIGVAVCYVFGTAWFMFLYTKNTGAVGLGTVLSWCVIPFIIPDLIKIAVAAVLASRLGKFIIRS